MKTWGPDVGTQEGPGSESEGNPSKLKIGENRNRIGWAQNRLGHHATGRKSRRMKPTMGTCSKATFSRLYKDADDQWQSTLSFGGDSLLRLADQAHSRFFELQREAAP